MQETKKAKAKEAPKPRLLLLPVFMAAFLGLWKLLGMGWVGASVLAVLLGGISYFLFVVLKVYRLLGRRETLREKQAHQAAAETARTVAQEGIVLLKNDGDLLPLPRGSKLNLVGLRCLQMSYNGGGSAATDESKCVTLVDGLQQTGFALNPQLLNLACNYLKNGKLSLRHPGSYRVRQGGGQKGGAEFATKPGAPVKPEIDARAFTDTTLYPDGRTVLAHAREYSEVALVVLSRGGGEGYDFDPADLQLTQSEKALLDHVCGAFEKVILVLNTANTVEMGWLKDYPQIRSVLWMGFPGTSGNLALGDILCGDCNPSGRLPDTWVASNLSAPAANNFCQRQSDGSWSKQSFHYENAPQKQGYFVHYAEGIYVGYRYFETRAAADPGFCYDSQVVWPFGYGLSYTTFSQSIRSFRDCGDTLELEAAVRNTGRCAGRCAVQCYVTAPYTGRLEKSHVQLAAFGKTQYLQPGEEACLSLNIPKNRLASFDAALGSWILEAGSYRLSLCADAHTILDSCQWDTQQVLFPGTKAAFADAHTDALTRSFDPAHRAFTGPRQEDYTASQSVLDALCFQVPDDARLGLTQMPTVGKDAGIRFSELKDLPKTDPKWDSFVQQLTLGELCDLCGNGAWQTRKIGRLGVPATKSPDGSTGMAATVFSALVLGSSAAGITWPCPSVLAAAFDPALAEQMGHALGQEGNAMGYQGWYAPSMNCHRTAFNSRNFEYYSEDPILSGTMAAGVVRAVQSHGIVPYIKHFALNERETNARDRLFTWCCEQAIREIYLRPFQLAVQDGGCLGVMSSFNFIGHTWSGGHRGLLEQVLRQEWGFAGAVVTDACMYPYMDVTQMLYAGGNLSLDTLGGFTGGNGKRKTLLAAAQDPRRQISMTLWLQRAAKDILYQVSKTGN